MQSNRQETQPNKYKIHPKRHRIQPNRHRLQPKRHRTQSDRPHFKPNRIHLLFFIYRISPFKYLFTIYSPYNNPIFPLFLYTIRTNQQFVSLLICFLPLLISSSIPILYSRTTRFQLRPTPHKCSRHAVHPFPILGHTTTD